MTFSSAARRSGAGDVPGQAGVDERGHKRPMPPAFGLSRAGARRCRFRRCAGPEPVRREPRDHHTQARGPPVLGRRRPGSGVGRGRPAPPPRPDDAGHDAGGDGPRRYRGDDRPGGRQAAQPLGRAPVRPGPQAREPAPVPLEQGPAAGGRSPRRGPRPGRAQDGRPGRGEARRRAFLRSAGPGANPRGADRSGARTGRDFGGASAGGALRAGPRGDAAVRNADASGAGLRRRKGWDATPDCDALVANRAGTDPAHRTAPADRSDASPNARPARARGRVGVRAFRGQGSDPAGRYPPWIASPYRNVAEPPSILSVPDPANELVPSADPVPRWPLEQFAPTDAGSPAPDG